MPDRTVLPNCCENWILAQGRFYGLGEAFAVLPCGHVWRREGEGEFRDQASVLWKVDFIKGFPYLKPERADPPILNRCCSTILIEHGPQIRDEQLPFQFGCPVCGTPWSIAQSVGADLLNVRLYTNKSVEKTFRLIDEAVPPYLELVAQHTLVT